MSENTIHVIIKRVNDRVTRHVVKIGDIDQKFLDNVFLDNGQDADETSTEKPNEENSASQVQESPFPNTFLDVEKLFSRSMMMYRNSVIETIKVAPILAQISLGNGIDKIAKVNGKKIEDLSSGQIEVYSLPTHAANSLELYAQRSESLVEGARHLPSIATIGIISSYDAILTDLLRVIFTVNPKIIFTSDREIKFSDLANFKNINDAKEFIVSNEIEGIMRQSHHEQFAWMEKKFKIQLREGLDVWPHFIELCERRNLLTHTGGIVSEQYLKNCLSFGNTIDKKIGDKLVVDLSYLKKSIDIVSEVGFKLIHTLWRKFCSEEREEADRSLNMFGMNLISSKQYDLAEKILKFGVDQKQHSSDLIKRMMIVNLANAAKLGGSKNRCDNLLSAHDWSATSYQFQISVAAVRNDFEEVSRLLLLGGSVINLSPSDFRNWPAFHDARKDVGVQEAFKTAFGESLVRSTKVVSRPASKKEDETGGRSAVS